MLPQNRAIILLFVRSATGKNTPVVVGTYMVPIFSVCILVVIPVSCNFLPYQDPFNSRIQVASVSSSIRPVRASINSPSRKANTHGILRMPNLAGVRRFDSLISNFTKRTSDVWSDTDSKIGPNIRHGPHHGAQKSTSVIPFPTNVSNVASDACSTAMAYSFLVDICQECIIIAVKCKRNHNMDNVLYFDAAASALKPETVIRAEVDFLQNAYANAGRGICPRAAVVDDMIARARGDVARFINARPDQIVFTSGTTDGMNRIVNIINDRVCGAGIKNKTVMVSDLDHHSARLPFELLYDSDSCKIVLCPMDKEYNLVCSDFPRADVFVITAMSNVMGIPQDVAELVAMARKKNPDVITVVDAAQYVVHNKIDVQKWDCDFMCFSAHKIGADTGLGIMYIKNPERWVSPDKFGGGMIAKITGSAVEHNVAFQWENAPAKFEAGTLPLTQIIGLPVAIDYLSANRPNLDLIKYLYDRLSKNPRIRIITPRDSALLTFYIPDMHVLDFGALVGARGLCLRVGNMCASWIHKALGIDGTARLSVGWWNSIDDASRACDIIEDVIK